MLKENATHVPRLFGLGELEKGTDISRHTWRRWARDGKVSHVRLGRRILIPETEVKRLIAAGTFQCKVA